jgi:beta-lactamase regulating signal transducer with metallopeptidase domain
MLELIVHFLLGAMVLSALWAVVAWALVKVLRIDSPGARFLVFSIPLLAALVTRIRLMPEWAGVIVGLSLAVALILLTWEIYRYLVFLKQVSADTRSDAKLERVVKDLAKSFKMKSPRVRVSGNPALSPFATGLLNPLLVVPGALLPVLNRNELRLLLAHELAHIRRRDIIWKWILLFMRYLAFLNPVAHYPYRWLSLEMERACDRLAASVTRKPGTLARTLLKVEEYLSQQASLVPAQPVPDLVARMSSHLSQRIELLATNEVETRAWSTVVKLVLVFSVFFLLCLRPGAIWLHLWAF